MTHCVNKGKRLLALFLALLMVCSIIAQMPIEADAATVEDHLEKYINTYGEKTDDGMQLLESFYQSESLIIASLETREDDDEERIFRFSMLITTEESKRVDIYAGFDFEVYGYPSEIVVEHAVLFYNNDKMYNSAYVEKTINYESHTNSSKYSVTSNCSLVSNSQFSGTFNSSLGMLLTYWDGYLYEELGFGLQALGFSSYESEFASDTSGRCGENVYWNFKSGTLNVFGTGDMYDYDVDNKYPWDAIKDDIERVVIEEGVTSIGCFAFWEYSNLKTAVIAGSIAKMESAFSGCRALTSVTLKEGLTEISAFAFDECTSLESVTIPDSVTIIDIGAFATCTNLKNVTFGKNVTYIGKECFLGCTALSNVVLPANLTHLGTGAFEECGDLGEIIIPSGITMFGYGVFDGSNVNYNIYNGAKYLGDGTNPYFVLMEAASKDVVSCDVHADTKIIADAFYQCQNLKTVTIPDGIRVVGEFAFEECTALETVVFSNSVQYIGDLVVYDCPNLKNVILGENVISIGWIDSPYNCDAIEYNRYDHGIYLGSSTNPYYALVTTDAGVKNFVAHKDTKVICGCALESEDLQTVDFGESLISFSHEAIGYSSVKAVTIPKTVKYIGEFAFDDCENLKNVYYEGTKSQWNEIQIEECNDLLLKATIHYAKLPKLTVPSVTVSDGELSWGSVANASYYEVYRSTSKSGTYKKLQQLRKQPLQMLAWREQPTTIR